MSTNSSLPSYCPHCGASVTSTSTTCAVCGKSLLTYNQAGNQSNTYYPPLEEDIPSTPFNVLAFFIPVVGVVLYALWSGQYPRKSRAVGKWALIGFVAPLIIGLLFMVLFFMIALLSFSR